MANFPAGTFIFSDEAIPTGWANYTAYGGKYVRGASLSSQLGTTGGSDTHKHASASLSSVAGHNHGGSQSAESSYQGGWYGSGGTGGTAAKSHAHTVTMNIDNNVSHVHAIGETGSANNDPSHTVLMLLRKS